MRKPTPEKKAGSDDVAEFNRTIFTASNNVQYFQAAVFWGEARRHLPCYLNRFKIHVFRKFFAPDGLALIGAGPYFSPFKLSGIECRCLDVCADVVDVYEPYHPICDLFPLVEFLRLRGGEHGCSTSGI